MRHGRHEKGLFWYLALPLAAAVLAAVAIFHAWDIAFLDNDAAQYLSVARNILDGNGLTSSIVFYEQQLAHGRVPAPQTVFPPGMSVVLAAFLAIGIEPPTAIVVAGIVGYGAIGIVIAMLLRRLGVGSLLAFLGVALWLGQGTAWANVWLGRSEILFTLATLLSSAVLVTAGTRRSRFVLAGALAAAAVLIRYQGLFFVAALVAWCAWCWLRVPSEQRSRFAANSAALLALPIAAVGLLMMRNLLLTGSAGGGPVDTVNWNAAHGIDIFRSAYWALTPFLGLSLEALAKFRCQELAFAAGFLMLAGWLVRNARALRLAPAHGDNCCARTAFGRLAIVYVLASCLALGVLATRSTGYMQGRFLLPLVPFLSVVWIMMLNRALKTPEIKVKVWLFVALIFLHGGLFAGQLRVLQDWLQDLRSDRRIEAMNSALAEEMSGVTVGQFLRKRVSNDSPFLATGGQRLWLLLELPVVEATPAGFSSRAWDEAELQRLNRCLGVRFLLYIPGVFDPTRPENRNQTLFQRLSRGDEPVGFAPILLTPNVHLYDLESLSTHGAHGAQDRGNDECK